MEHIPDPFESGSSPSVVIVEPTNELLQKPTAAADLWPEITAANPSFLHQLQEHAALSQNLNAVFDNLDPTEPLESAVQKRWITESQAIHLYDDLSEVLKDPENINLIFYLPFEILPRRHWLPENSELQRASDAFRDSYLAAWYRQLSVEQVRANFVDGDVSEAELECGDIPRVVKAAHLIPKLVAGDILDAADVIDLLTQNPEPMLKRSLTEAVLVLDDLGLIDRDDYVGLIDETVNPVRAAKPREDQANITASRRAWLKRVRTEQEIAGTGRRISEIINNGELSLESVTHMAIHADSHRAKVLIEGIRGAVEMAPDYAAAETYEQYESLLLSFWQHEDASVQTDLTKALRRLYRLGVAPRQTLDERNIALPKLTGNLSENLDLYPEDMRRIQDVAASLEADPALANVAYPVVSVCGSRLKGYGDGDSDIDLGVFIKPLVSKEQQAEVRDLLHAKFVTEFGLDAPITFWLDEAEDGELKIHDFDGDDVHTADSYWTHMLFSAAWVGNPTDVRDLQNKLLPDYFRDSDRRAAHLERIEQDILQYRLMHKGYDRHYPRVTKLSTTHAHLVDGDSAFWDSGYRQLATRLFVDKVFLPKL